MLRSGGLESTFNQRELHDVPLLGFVSLVFVVYVEMCSESAFLVLVWPALHEVYSGLITPTRLRSDVV